MATPIIDPMIVSEDIRLLIRDIGPITMNYDSVYMYPTKEQFVARQSQRGNLQGAIVWRKNGRHDRCNHDRLFVQNTFPAGRNYQGGTR